VAEKLQATSDKLQDSHPELVSGSQEQIEDAEINLPAGRQGSA